MVLLSTPTAEKFESPLLIASGIVRKKSDWKAAMLTTLPPTHTRWGPDSGGVEELFDKHTLGDSDES